MEVERASLNGRQTSQQVCAQSRKKTGIRQETYLRIGMRYSGGGGQVCHCAIVSDSQYKGVSP